MRERIRTLSVRLDDTELSKLHALAENEDMPIGAMLRRWMNERWRASFGDTPPPAAKTKFGSALRPKAKR